MHTCYDDANFTRFLHKTPRLSYQCDAVREMRGFWLQQKGFSSETEGKKRVREKLKRREAQRQKERHYDDRDRYRYRCMAKCVIKAQLVCSD